MVIIQVWTFASTGLSCPKPHGHQAPKENQVLHHISAFPTNASLNLLLQPSLLRKWGFPSLHSSPRVAPSILCLFSICFFAVGRQLARKLARCLALFHFPIWDQASEFPCFCREGWGCRKSRRDFLLSAPDKQHAETTSLSICPLQRKPVVKPTNPNHQS